MVNINSNTKPIYVKNTGLNAEEITENRQKYGANIISKKKRKGFFSQLINNFDDPIIKILIGALIINTLLNIRDINIPETVGIGAAVIIATLVSTISEYGSSLAFDKLCNSNSSMYSVRRGGEIVTIKQEDVVVGDIVLLSPGEKIPADGYITQGAISCDQSALTGESKEIHKNACGDTIFYPENVVWEEGGREQLFGGCIICTGACEMIVLRVGADTFIGKIASELQESGRPSPLKNKLSDLADTISYIGYVSAAMIAIAYLFNAFFIESGMNMDIVMNKLSNRAYLISELISAVTVAVSALVVAVPEGLPMMITVVLSSNMKKMLRNGVLVRRLVGIETAGNMNILFTDKTGTITAGKMKVTALVGTDFEYNSLIKLKKNKELYRVFCECTDASCAIGKMSSTERSLIDFFSINTRASVERVAFDSKVKYSGGIIDGKKYSIGAPEVLLLTVNRAFNAAGEIGYLTPSQKGKLYNELDELCGRGSRVVCCVMDDVFIGFIAINDPIRPDILRSIKDAHSAGIHVVMVTGDNIITARAIAEKTGIIRRREDKAILASELSSMTDLQIEELLPDLAVVSRALPQDKLRLVKIAQKCGNVVGMTGDGVNDAPALKAADVGFSMGSGCDIAKEASDIVITDDSFSSITKSVLYGRTIFESIRKFIVFQLTMNFCAMGISIVGPFIGVEKPITVVQMLWVNLIMDTLGGLAFAGEAALSEYMKRKSYGIGEKILSKNMYLQILINGGYALAVCLIFLKSNYFSGMFSDSGEVYFLTVFFSLLIFCGIFTSFVSRTNRINIFANLTGNPAFIIIMTAVAIAQLMIIYYGGSIFRCVPIEKSDLLVSATLALSVIPADFLRKIIIKSIKKYGSK